MAVALSVIFIAILVWVPGEKYDEDLSSKQKEE